MEQHWGKREEDNGQESLYVILARIDERTKNTDDKLDKHITKFDNHVVDDSKNFSNLNRFMWIGLGALAVIKFFFGK